MSHKFINYTQYQSEEEFETDWEVKSGQGPERADFSICQELIRKICEPTLLLIHQLPGIGRTQEGGQKESF